MNARKKNLPLGEFIALLALMTSIIALSTDMMLPALEIIGKDLNVANANDPQLIISSLFLGLAIGNILAGPLSDSYGRKPVIYFGYLVFVLGCVLSLIATDLTLMLVGRVLQGFGAAFPRIVTLALVRDLYEGRAMARIMSIVMAVFIIVPAISPAIGQGILLISHWRHMFTLLMIMAILTFIWFALRQRETLGLEARRKLSLNSILGGIKECISIRAALGYTISAGLIFGAFLGYLSSAQQIFQVAFGVGELFPIYFGTAALSIGLASVINSKLVIKHGMRWLTIRALVVTISVSTLFLIPSIMMNGVPPLWMFMVWLLIVFFAMGIMFGNFNAMAMEPLGHMAGLGAAFVGALSTFISLPLGWAVGHFFDGGVLPLVSGFALCGIASYAMLRWADAPKQSPSSVSP